MTQKQIFGIILKFHGYDMKEYSAKWTGTSDGQFENSINYRILSENKSNGDCIRVDDSGFEMALFELFKNLHTHNAMPEYISDETFKQTLLDYKGK